LLRASRVETGSCQFAIPLSPLVPGGWAGEGNQYTPAIAGVGAEQELTMSRNAPSRPLASLAPHSGKRDAGPHLSSSCNRDGRIVCCL
jgi:hypothetical protein